MNTNRLATSALSRAARPTRAAPARRLWMRATGITLALALVAAPRPDLAAPEGGGFEVSFYDLAITPIPRTPR